MKGQLLCTPCFEHQLEVSALLKENQRMQEALTLIACLDWRNDGQCLNAVEIASVALGKREKK